MPIPDSPREIYNHNPLKEVLVQLRFPTILRVESETPAQFQNKIRREYPLYEEASSNSGLPKEISDVLNALSIPILPKQTPQNHNFITEDRSRFISLNQDFLAVTEKKYTQWECFRNEIILAEEAFRNIYEPSFYSRIGLRYIDFIDRKELGLESLSWNELLNEGFIGQLGASDFAEEVSEIKTQSIIRIPSVQSGAVTIRHGLARSSEDSNRFGYSIDADFSTTKRCTPDDAFNILDTFNNLGGRLFRWTIKPRLRDAMDPTRI